MKSQSHDTDDPTSERRKILIPRRRAVMLGAVGAAAVASTTTPSAAVAAPVDSKKPPISLTTTELQSLLDQGGYIVIPPGEHEVSIVYVKSGSTIENQGTIKGIVRVMGPNRDVRGMYYTHRVNGQGALTAGQTTFSGDFSAYNAGDFILIGLQGIGSPTNNQSGFDYGIVTAASSASLTIDTPTRFAFNDWYIAKTVGRKVSGALGRFASKIAGDYRSLFAPGDLVRVENINGQDCPWDATAFPHNLPWTYFELVRVASVTATEMIFEQTIAYNHDGVYLVKMDKVSNVDIFGGYIDNLQAAGADTLTFRDLRCATLSVGFTVGFEVTGIRADGSIPRVVGFSSVRDGTISDIVTRGGRGTTDNGSMKLMSPVDVTVSNIHSFDSASSGAGGVYPFFIDFPFTPYAGWAQGLTVSNLVLARPSAGRQQSFWAVGTRDARVSNVVADGGFRVAMSSNFSASGLRAKHVSLEDNVDGMLVSDLVAESLNLQGCHDAVITTALLNPPSGANGNRAVTVLKGKVYPSSRIQFRDIRNLATTGDATFYFENSSDIMMKGCTDRLGLAKSVRFGPNVTGTVTYGVNGFLNPVDRTSAEGVTTANSDLQLGGHGWQHARLRLGDYYLWVDATGKVRIKNGQPTSDTDGTILGSQS